jgi:hypothetical protein
MSLSPQARRRTLTNDARTAQSREKRYFTCASHLNTEFFQIHPSDSQDSRRKPWLHAQDGRSAQERPRHGPPHRRGT